MSLFCVWRLRSCRPTPRQRRRCGRRCSLAEIRRRSHLAHLEIAFGALEIAICTRSAHFRNQGARGMDSDWTRLKRHRVSLSQCLLGMWHTPCWLLRCSALGRRSWCSSSSG
eukprot:3405991-Pleurochrysis_carterae.AAC.1